MNYKKSMIKLMDIYGININIMMRVYGWSFMVGFYVEGGTSVLTLYMNKKIMWGGNVCHNPIYK